jgi:hypothetical protein
MHTLTCVCCGVVLTPVFEENDCFQPNEGIICSSEGNYGSTRFDPITEEERGDTLLFFLCDDCLVERRDSIFLVKVKRRKPVPASRYLAG